MKGFGSEVNHLIANTNPKTVNATHLLKSWICLINQCVGVKMQNYKEKKQTKNLSFFNCFGFGEYRLTLRLFTLFKIGTAPL